MKTKLIICIYLVLSAAFTLGAHTAPASAATGIQASSFAPVNYGGIHNGRLAFGMNVNGNIDIYSMLPNGKALQRLTTDPAFDACPSWSADGKEITYCSSANSPSGVFEIWTMKANGTQQRQVTHLGGSATFPNFSPNGSTIAFGATLPGTTGTNIFVINKDGSNLVQLTNTTDDNLYPRWSPDGRKIAFLSSRTGILQVWVMNADGSNPTQLTFDATPKDQLPDWKPDGTEIAYTSGDDIYVMNADGSNQRQLTTTGDPSYDFGPAWSPDGTQIAFLRFQDGVGRYIYIMNADGSNQHPVNPTGGTQFVPSWQPRGDTAY